MTVQGPWGPTPTGGPPAVGPPPRPDGGPTTAGYKVGGIIAGFGVVLAVVLIVLGVAGAVHGGSKLFSQHVLGRVRANHEIHVDLKSTNYVLAYESKAVNSSITSEDEVPHFSVKVTDPSGDEVPLDGYVESYTYVDGSHDGIVVKAFDAPRSGTYRVKVGSLPGGSDARVAVSEQFSTEGAASFAGGIAAIFVGIWGGAFLAFVGCVILLITALRRYFYQQRMTRPITASWPQPYAPVTAYPPAPAPPSAPAPPPPPPPAPAPPTPTAPAPPTPAPAPSSGPLPVAGPPSTAEPRTPHQSPGAGAPPPRTPSGPAVTPPPAPSPGLVPPEDPSPPT